MPTLPRRVVLVACASSFLAACHSSDDDGAPPPPPPPTFAVGGTVSGLDGAGLVLQLNNGPDLAISADGAFTFANQVAGGAAYAVTIKTQPRGGSLQLCTVTNGSGTMPSSAVTNVAITCAPGVFKFLYTTSTVTDDLRGFAIDTASGALTALPGAPVLVGVDPVVPVAHPSGKFVYVAARGNQSVPPRLSVLAADNTTGALTEIAQSPYELSSPPPQPGAQLVLPLFIHPSGAFGYLAVSYATTLLYGATIDATTGALTAVPGTPIAMGEEEGVGGLFYDSSGSFAFLPISPNRNGEIRTFLVNTPSGVLTPIGTFPTGGGPAGAFFAPGEAYLLATNFDSGTLIVFAVDKSAGTLTPVTNPIPTGPAGSQPLGLVFNRRNDVFYVTHVRNALTPNAPTSVAAFDFDPTTGGVTAIGAPVATNGATSFAFLHPSGRFLFQYNASIGSLQRFVLDDTTGAPTLSPDLTAIAGAPQQINLILDPSGKFLYVTSSTEATVSSYSIDETSGALTLVNSLPTSAGALATLPFLLQ